VKRPHLFIIGILVFCLVVSSLLVSCKTEETARLKVVTSISLIAQIVERIGGDLVDVVNIIPPAQCPGHFDVKPSDIQKLADADLFLLGGWQGEMFSQELIDSANNPYLTVVTLDIPSDPQSNWMTPSVQQEAVDRIATALSQVDIQNSTSYQDLAAIYKNQIELKAAEIEEKLAGENLSATNVICSGMQAAFLKWVGLNVVTFYGRPDTIPSPRRSSKTLWIRAGRKT